MKVTLEYKVPEDNDTLELALNANTLFSIIDGFDRFMRMSELLQEHRQPNFTAILNEWKSLNCDKLCSAVNVIVTR